MRTLDAFALAAFTGFCGVAPSVHAQVATGDGKIQLPARDAVGGGEGDVFSGDHAFPPIRLSLQGSVFPQAGGFPNCLPIGDDVTGSVSPILTGHHLEGRLVPRLVLSGFSQLGCPVDGGLGGAITYRVPIRDSMAVVLGAGIYAAPGQLPLYGGLKAAVLQGVHNQLSAVHEAARVDLAWRANNGRNFSFGVESTGIGAMGIRFGVSGL